MPITSKIHAARSKRLSVVKTGEINIQGRKMAFVSYADIWSQLGPALESVGLSLGFSKALIRVDQNSGHEIVSMVLEVSDGEEERTSDWEMILPEVIKSSTGNHVTNNAQRVTNAESYLKRTALLHYFGIVAGNEDEVERMTPEGSQINIPGAIPMAPTVSWQMLTEELWRKAMSPLHDGVLDKYPPGELSKMWADHPDHPGLQAWGADWIVHWLGETGKTWDDLVEADPGLPKFLTNCTGAHLRAAASVLKGFVRDSKSNTTPE